MDERPVAYGYLRIPDDTPDHWALDLDLALVDAAHHAGVRLSSVFVEPVDGVFTVLEELITGMRSTGTRYVLVPTLDHLGRHPAMRTAVLARLGRLARATVIVAGDEARTIAAGPFDCPPLDLLDVIPSRPDGTWLRGSAIVDRTADWLLATLDEAGVSLGDYDRDVVEIIAGHGGWPAAQAVVGWISRAR